MEDHTNDTDLLARWLNDDLTPEENARLEKDGQLDALRAVVDDIDSWTLPKMDTDHGLEALKSQLDKPEAKIISMTTWMRIAASVALLVTAFYGWDYFFNNEVLIRTGIAEKQEVELPDGSTVNLDASSSLAYSKRGWEENREVSISGQAFLSVEKGGSFLVKTEKGNVSVLGTQFNVTDRNNRFEVACYEGKVRVESKGKREIIEAGQGVRLSGNELIRTEIDSDVPNWMSGFSAYQEASLNDVTADLKTYYEIELELPEKYAELRFSGRFTHSNIDRALRSVFATMEINYTLDSSGRVDFE